MTIYVDLVLLSNFLLDYSVITYTGVLTQTNVKIGRVILATIFAVLSLSIFFIKLTALFIILRIIWSIGIILIAFDNRTMRQFLKNIVIFYLINYLCAGIILSFDFQFYDNSILLINNRTTWYILFFSFIFSNILTYTYKVIMEKNAKIKATIFEIAFSLFGHVYKTTGLLDTGNVVCTAKDQLPVIFIDKGLVREDFSKLAAKDPKLTLVHYKTINGTTSSIAIKPDYFNLIINNKELPKEVYLAFIDKIGDINYNAILNYQIFL